MDFKSKCRTWTGNIYHKFEAICHEVDDFVGKDNVKYLENQVQIVGESVKKVYAKVLHDFGPPMAYNKQGENCASKKHDDATGSYTRSAVGGSDSRSCQLEDSAGHIHCNDHQKHYNPSTSAEIPEKPNNIINPDDAKKIVVKEKHSICRDLYCGDSPPSFIDRDKHPLIVRSDSIERSSAEHLLTVISESLESKSLFGSVDISDVEGCMSNTVAKFSTENLVEVVELKSNQNCKTITNIGVLPEGEETILSSKPVIPFLNTSEMNAQTNASNEDILVSDVECLVEEKDYSGSAFYSKEHQPLTVNLCFLHDENSLCTGLGLVHIDETMCNNIEPYKLIEGYSSSERDGDVTNFDKSDEVEGKDDKTVAVECTSRMKYEKPCAVYMGDKQLTAEASNFLENEALEHGNDIHPDAFLNFELLPEFQEERREKSISDGYEQVESDVSIIKEDGDDILSYSNPTMEENQISEHGVEVYESFPKYECSSNLASADTCESSKRVRFDESIATDNFMHFCGDTKLKAHTSTSNSGCGDDSAVDIDDSVMENIDLTNEVKAEEASLVEDWLVHAASCRPRRAKSYKRLVLNALGSRKRLIKEYEQLAILCGEINDDDDAVSSLQQEHSLFHPPVTAVALCATSSPTYDSCEPGWELV